MAKIVLDFKPGDNVWLMYNNNPVNGIIKKVWYTKFTSPVDFESVVENETYNICVGFQELGAYKRNELFSNKEDLIKSL